MAAPDYREDLFQKIKSISFPSNWIAMSCSRATGPPPLTILGNLIDQSGGTPGYPLFVADVTPNCPLFPAPPTKADMTAQIRTNAGSSHTGFYRKNFNAAPGLRNGVTMFLKLDSSMPSSPFRFQFDISCAGVYFLNNQPVSVDILKGLKVGSFGNAVQHAETTWNGNQLPRTINFSINPSRLTVTGP